MHQSIADLLAPMVRDHINNREDSYYFGCVAGACDLLEKQGLITEAEYGWALDAADRRPDVLLACLYDVEDSSIEPLQEKTA